MRLHYIGGLRAARGFLMSLGGYRMKRRVLSLGMTLALCLNLCPVWVLAAGETPDNGLCPRHPAHTEECGYIPSTPGCDCAHEHDDDCYTIVTDCAHEHTSECYSAPDYDPEVDEPDLCTHICTEDSGCVTPALTCPHEHDDTCGYEPESPGAPCTFVCPICPIDDLIARLPRGVSADNSERVQAQLDEIFTLYDQLTADERRQVDLSPCLALWNQVEELGAAELNSDLDDSLAADGTYKLLNNKSLDTPLVISRSMVVDTNGFTLTGTSANTIEVTEDGILRLKGTVVSNRSAGVRVQSGGSLTITEPGTSIKGFSYALDIASGANVQLSAGTYFGQRGAIQTEEGDFAALLAPGYAYFDETGSRISLTELASSAPPRTVVVARCTDHDKAYTPFHGDVRHTWLCSFCGETGTDPCTFTFEDETGVCDLCGDEITVAVDRNSLKALAYDENIKPANGTITVTTKDGTTLTENTHYTVTYTTQADMGSTDITITVTVEVGDNQGTFTQDYTFTQAELNGAVLEWSQPGPVNLPYDGAPVKASELPSVIINNINSNGTDLSQYLQYSYRVKAPGDTAYTDGLPANAGTYEVVASLPEKPTTSVPGYQAASSEPITLIIEKISPIVTPPKAIQPEFNGTAQKLVTAGTLHSAAERDGVEILFATSEHGTYLPDIPTGINAGGDYEVWYQTEETENYLAVGPFEISDVEIRRKKITPIVKLSEYTYLYDGGEKEPKVTVKDEDDVTELLDTEYQVKYVNNRNVSTDGNPAKVVVSDKDGGNYEITEVEVEFKITSKEQATLTITNKPNTVTYGDKFTLETNGGSGNGEVTWKITDGTDVAEVDENSGQVIIVGHGSFTVQAAKSGKDPVTGVTNYDDAIATWPITADKKSVVATVTAEDKNYSGDDEATIHAEVETGVLPGDQIIITDLKGAFSDENAGADKTVTVNFDGAWIAGKNSEHYDVSYSSTTVTATIHKAIANIKTPPNGASLTYNGTSQALMNDTSLVVDPGGVLVEYAMSEGGPYSTAIPEETNAGTYTVWYRVQETQNYTGLAPASVDVEIKKKPVTPDITLSGDGLWKDDTSASPIQYYIYDGAAKTPTVTLNDENGNEIPGGEYTVAYSNNTDVGIATVTVAAKEGGNYSFTPNPATKDFRIKEEQAKVTTAPEPAGLPLTFSTYAQKLVTAGDGTGGTMVYFLADPADPDNSAGTYEETIPTATNAGEYTVYYKVAHDDNHSDSAVGQVKVTIAPKTVKDPTIELELLDDNGDPIDSYTYDGDPKKPAVTVKYGSDVIDAGEYNIIYSDNVDAGKGTVDITDKQGGNYTVTGSATFVILKADIKFAPDPSDAQAVYNGTEQELLKPGTTSGGEVLYALNSPTSAYTAAIPTAINAGQYTVYYKVVGDKNHNDFAVQSVAASILPKPLTSVTIELSPRGFEYDGQVKLPEITVMDGKTVLPEEEYTWSCDVENPTNEGVYTITIANSAGGNYDLSNLTAPTSQATFTIGKTEQAELVIDHSDAVTTNYGDTFALSASGGSSSGAVTWIPTGPATVDTDGNVEITGVGEVTITATNPGDQNYLPVSAQWTFTAAPKPVTASVVAASRAYDGTTDATVTSASIAGGDLVDSGDVVTIDKASITAEFVTASVGIGKTVTLDTSRVKVTGDDADKYAISYPATVTADITQETTRFIANPEKIDPLTYTGQLQALVTAGETNVGFIVYSLERNGTYSTAIPTGTDAGLYTVYYKVDGTTDYTAEPGGSITVTIGRKTIGATVEPSESSYVYDSAKHEPSITVKDGRTVIDEDQYTVTWADDNNPLATDVLTNVGTYTATITGNANGNYDFTATAKVKIVPASQAALTITGQPDHVYYGDTVRTLNTTGGTGQGAVAWSVTAGETSAFFDMGTSVLHINGTGPITVKAERTVPNYGTVSDTWTFTVEPKPVVAEVTISAKDYDGTTAVDDGDITAVVKASDLVDADNDTITIDDLMGTYDNANAGTNKTVALNDSNVKITGDTGKYAVSCPATVKADINPRPVSVSVALSGNDLKTDNSTTPPTYSYEYDGTEKKPAVTVEGTDASGYRAILAPSDYTVSYANNKNVDNATVIVTRAEDGNYRFTEAKVPFAIKKAAVQLTRFPQANDLTYTGQPQELVAAGTAIGGHIEYTLDNTAPNSYSTTIPKRIDAGTYTVYYKVVGDGNHEGGTTFDQMSVTIKPKPVNPSVTLILASDPLPYTGTAQKPTSVTVTVDNAPLAEYVDYTIRYSGNINPGTATVEIQSVSGSNYQFYTTRTFEIAKTKATFLKLPEGLTDLVYTGEEQELIDEDGIGISLEGIVVYSRNAVTYSADIPTGTKAGAYTIFAKVLGDSTHEDSDIKPIEAKINVNRPDHPTIELPDGDSFSYTGSPITPAVIVRDDSNRIIPATEYTVSYENNTAVSSNSAKIKITSKGSNYSFTAEKTFAIVGADQLLTITGKPDTVYYGDELNLIATGGSAGGAVTWTTEGPVAGGDGQFKIIGSGKVTITAAKAANGNYGAATGALEFYANPRPVTATVTAKDKPYDGKAGAELSVIFRDLLPGESIAESGYEVKGQFSDAEAGTDKTVTISLTVTDDTINAKYAIDYNRKTTASITPVAASVAADPQAISGLTYTGNEQELVTDGTAVGGNLVYSLNGVDYTPGIPKGKDAGPYTLWYKVIASGGNYKDSGTRKMTVDIAPYTGALTVECTPDTFRYDNTAKAPATIRVLDSNNRAVPESEYSVTIPSNAIAADTYTVTVKDIRNSGNYEFETPVTGTFKIEKTSQEPLSIIASEYTVYYGDTFRLSATGGSGSGAIHWNVAETAVAAVDGNGVVTVTGTGSFTVKAYQEASGGYEQSNTASVTFYADPKPVRPVVTAKDKTFDGTRNAVLSASLEADALVKGDNDIQLTVVGQFDTADVGTSKQVEITSHGATGANVSKYQIIWPVSTTASIAKADAAIDTPPAALDPVYNKAPQALVSGGSTVNSIGVIKYSRTQGGVYSTAIPKGTNAGTYSVWYKVEGSANYTGLDPAEILVTIAQAKPTIETQPTASGTEGQTLNEIGFSKDGAANVPGTFVWKDGTIKPPVGTTQQDAIFTPEDAANYEAIPIQITVTISAASGTGSGTSGTPTTSTGGTPTTGATGTSMRTTVRNGTASTVVSAAAGSGLVREAAANQSQSIVIQPEITGEVTKTEVSIPASTVSQIGRETSAALTVSAPIADVTIPNSALDTLSSAGGTVRVVTEQVEQTVVLTLTAGGETVERVPGGVTLTVPVEDAGPGTVAVLVNEDGTRETLRKVVVEDGSLSIPLSGSATVEIVDNSKDFTDVPATSWAADAVAFASARELFSGTSETTFSPEETMSRGMLVTVLYRLEGLPPQDLTSVFNDVGGEDWYADSIAWASENGITNGYGNGQFGPKDSVTREQFVVMLWKYAGSPVANGRTLSFTDADQVSGYALEALCWAVENGILSGYSDGQLAPGGTATRAQAAQMLKNFMENT